MTFILHLIRWQGLRLGSTRLDAAYLFECILKILKLDNCIAVVVAVVVVAACVVMVHDPVAKVWRAYANCGNKTVKISMPVAGNGTAKKGKGTRRGLGRDERRRGEQGRVVTRWDSEPGRAWLSAALTAKQFAEISLKLNEIVKSISHILPLPVKRKKSQEKKKTSQTFSASSLPFPSLPLPLPAVYLAQICRRVSRWFLCMRRGFLLYCAQGSHMALIRPNPEIAVDV